MLWFLFPFDGEFEIFESFLGDFADKVVIGVGIGECVVLSVFGGVAEVEVKELLFVQPWFAGLFMHIKIISKTPTGGIEPPTFHLTGERSANWATQAVEYLRISKHFPIGYHVYHP